MSAPTLHRLVRSRHSENRAFFVHLDAHGHLVLRPRLRLEELASLAEDPNPPSGGEYVLRPRGSRNVPTEWGYRMTTAGEGLGFLRIPAVDGEPGKPVVVQRMPQHYPTVLFDAFLEDIARFPELSEWRDAAAGITNALSPPCRNLPEAHQLVARLPEFVQLRDNPGLQLTFTLWAQRVKLSDTDDLRRLLTLPRQQLLEKMFRAGLAPGALSLLSRLRTPGIDTASWPRGGSAAPDMFEPVTWNALLDRFLLRLGVLLGSEEMIQLARSAPAIGELHLRALPPPELASRIAACPAFRREWLSLPVVEEPMNASHFGGVLREIESLTALCRDVIDLGEHAGIENADLALQNCQRVTQLQRLHDRWLERSLQAPLTLMDGTLPTPRLNGSSEIKPIGSLRALRALAAQQRNCVGSYGPRIRAREIDVYAVEVDGEHATLAIALKDRFGEPIQPRVEELKGACNQKASRRLEMTVRRWLRVTTGGQHPPADQPG